jgi:hypothetical protein
MTTSPPHVEPIIVDDKILPEYYPVYTRKALQLLRAKGKGPPYRKMPGKRGRCLYDLAEVGEYLRSFPRGGQEGGGR